MVNEILSILVLAIGVTSFILFYFISIFKLIDFQSGNMTRHMNCVIEVKCLCDGSQ